MRPHDLSEYSSSDYEFMARALRLARHGMYTAHPNPRVGCVIVGNGKIIGEGWHRKTGAAHAEINALKEAGAAAHGATAFVTLEPCVHRGKTAPCAEALIDAGIARVVVAMQDPFLKVNGNGLTVLQNAGLDVRVGLMSEAAMRLNEGFVSRITRHRPFIRLKTAASLDGCTAMQDGESQWISGPEARAEVQHLRAASGAVMTGIGTVLADNPSLTVRDATLVADGVQPLRVVVDSNLRIPPSARMLRLPGETAVFCINDGNRSALEEAGAQVVAVPAREGRVDLNEVFAHLARLEINDVLVEAGHTLAGSLLSIGLVDELIIYQSPHIMGSRTQRMFSTPGWQSISQRLQLEIVDVRRVGADMRITARPAAPTQ